MMGLAIVLFSAAMQAQPGSDIIVVLMLNRVFQEYRSTPNLTEEQEQKITALHTSYQKEVLNSLIWI
jgi:hypothetical protein